MMLIMMVRALRFGGRRADASTRSFLEQVRISLIVRAHIVLTCSVGTGGTISGTGQYLKSMNDDILVVLSDPEGSGLYNKVRIPRPLSLSRSVFQSSIEYSPLCVD